MNVALYDKLEIYLVAAAFLLAIGIYGLMRRRTLIRQCSRSRRAGSSWVSSEKRTSR